MAEIPDAKDVESFIDNVDDISRLIEGLKEGTISPEYVDGKITKKKEKEEAKQESLNDASHGKRDSQASELTEKQKEEEEEKRARLMEKALELKTTYERKLKARAKFEEKYVNNSSTKDQTITGYGTDYSKWDLWCPEDETDDLISQITPANQAFKAMEKDIDDRHKKMIEQRQIAERQRVKGNKAYAAKQYTEALASYEEGLNYEKTNMALHGNAAMAALKTNCYVSTIEHCDKVLNIAELFHGPQTLSSPLCTKAYQRRATAFLAIQQHARAVSDLELALKNDPSSKEIHQQLENAKLKLEEHKKQGLIKKAMRSNEKDQLADGEAFDIEKLRKVEQLVLCLTTGPPQPQSQPQPSAAAPLLPRRPGDKSKVSPNDDKVKVLKDLTRLVKDDDAACVYLRECGGLDAAGKIVVDTSSTFPPSAGKDAVILSLRMADAAIDLLEASCLNDGNLTSLPLLLLPQSSPSHVQGTKSREGQVLQAVAKLLQPLPDILQPSSLTDTTIKSHPAATVATMLVNAAAARLLCTASTKESIRPAISKGLVGFKSIGLRSLIVHHLPASNQADEVAQYSALALLGNCMVDGSVKEAMRDLIKEKDVGNSLATLIGQAASAHVSERALVIFGNMCGDPALRKSLIQLSEVISSAVKFALQSSSKDLELASATFLFNASIEGEAQAALINLIATKTSSPAFWPGLMSNADHRVASRAAGTLARCCKQVHPRLYSSDGNDILSLSIDLLRRSLDQEVGSGGCNEDAISSAEGCIRALALLTQTQALGQGSVDFSSSSGHVSEVIRLGGADLLVRSCRILLGPEKVGSAPSHQRVTRDSALGNASLCIGHLTASEEALDTFSQLDAVQPLVRVAYECTGRGAEGETAVRNAAIALAKMAKRPEMLERLRELHGIEIIARNVKKF